MRTWLNFNRGVLFFSTLMVLLLLWLSVSFLLQAYVTRQDAQFLARYLKSDMIVRNSVMAVVKERAASHWLTGIDGLLSVKNSLVNSHKATDDSIRILYDEIEQILTDNSFSSQLTYQRAQIEELVGSLSRSVDELPFRRLAIIDDLDMPVDKRSQRLELSVFDSYGQLIGELEELRVAIRYRPSRLSREIDTGSLISNAAWDLTISHYSLSAIFETYLTSGKTGLGTAHERSLSMQRNIVKRWDQLKNVDAYNGVNQQLRVQAIELNEWFGQEYFPQVERMTQAIGTLTPASYTNWKWRKLARALEKHMIDIFDQADKVSAQRIDAVLRRATRNFFIDIVLVLTCACLMFSALWVGRRIHFQANHDDLTQLSNRGNFKSQCELALNDAKAKGHNYVLIVLNVDHFKSVNDSLGQVNGDRLLQGVAQRISDAAGTESVVARMGGDEFSVLKGFTDEYNANAIVNRIANTVSNSLIIDSQSVPVSARIGYSLYPRDASTLEGLRKAADLAIHSAGQNGEGSIVAFNPAIAIAFQGLQSLKSDLKKAINGNEFELHYQPQVDLQLGEVDGFEALLRWNHPQRGKVSPFHFIPVAEDAGLLPQIGSWVIEEAARQAAEWRDSIGLELKMSVNVSVHQFLHGDIEKIVQHALDVHGLSATCFEIEITESVAMAEMDRVLETLRSIRQMGVRIALDDFGTGYSSLGYLQDLPLDTLKIDRSFISKLGEGTGDQLVLLESISHIARSLNFHTVAEGVETASQLHHVRALGVDTVQGYFYSKPLPAIAVPESVERINAEHSFGTQQRAA